MVVFRSSGLVSYCAGSGGLTAPIRVLREAGPVGAPKPRLLDRVRAALGVRHYSRRTEEAYVAWIRRYIFFHGKRHPAEMAAPEITRFLTSLAVDGNVAASTQNQALNALLFLYREVLELTAAVARWRRPREAPAALTGGAEPRRGAGRVGADRRCAAPDGVLAVWSGRGVRLEDLPS